MTDFDIYLQWGIAALVAIAMLLRGQLTLFHPTAVYLAFHVVVFCLRPTMVHFYDFDFVFRYLELTPRPGNMLLALHLSSAGLVAFFAAFTLFTVGAQPLRFGEKRELDDVDRRAFFYALAIFLPLGLYSVIAAKPQLEEVDGIKVNVGTSGYVNDLQNVLIPLCIVFVLVSRWRWWSYLPFGGYVFFRMMQGWGRWTFVLSCFVLLLVWMWDHRRRMPPVHLMLPLPFLAMLFLWLSHDRNFVRRWVAGEESANVARVESSSDWRDKWDTQDFANFDYLTFVVTHVPRNTKSYSYGTQYLQLFTEPIPRKLWKDKPVGAPIKWVDLFDQRYGNFKGSTPSLVGDGWMSGGWVGAMLTMALAGGALGLGFRWFTRNQEIPHRACAFLIVNAMCIQLYRDGGISIFKFLLFALSPLFVWAFFSRRLAATSAVAEERAALKEARFRRFAAAGGAGGAAGVLASGEENDADDESPADEDAEAYGEDWDAPETLEPSSPDDEADPTAEPPAPRRRRPGEPT